MKPAQFNQIREALGSFYWDNDFETFCRVTGFNPQFPYAEEKWQQFITCVQLMGQFDDATWEKIVSASFANQR
jgi:transposase